MPVQNVRRCGSVLQPRFNPSPMAFNGFLAAGDRAGLMKEICDLRFWICD
jgi:hypothetical protein